MTSKQQAHSARLGLSDTASYVASWTSNAGLPHRYPIPGGAHGTRALATTHRAPERRIPAADPGQGREAQVSGFAGALGSIYTVQGTV